MITIQKKVSVVFRILDSVTGKPVNRNLVSLYANGRKVETMAKNDGYFVVMNLPEDSCRFEVRSRIYQPDGIHIKLSEMDRTDPVIPMILNPGPNYPGVARMTSVTGSVSFTAAPADKTEILIVYSSMWEKIKIAQEAVEKGSTRLKLYTSGNRELPGRLFFINDREEKNGELCRIVQGPDAEGNYILAQGVGLNHRRGDFLKNVVKVSVDNTGGFLAAIHDLDPDKPEAGILLYASGKGTGIKSAALAVDRVNDVGILNA